jgi:hypothetical protein
MAGTTDLLLAIVHHLLAFGLAGGARGGACLRFAWPDRSPRMFPMFALTTNVSGLP